MSGSGPLQTQKQRDEQKIEFDKEIEDNALLKLIYHKLDRILQQLEIITEDKIL